MQKRKEVIWKDALHNGNGTMKNKEGYSFKYYLARKDTGVQGKFEINFLCIRYTQILKETYSIEVYVRNCDKNYSDVLTDKSEIVEMSASELENYIDGKMKVWMNTPKARRELVGLLRLLSD